MKRSIIEQLDCPPCGTEPLRLPGPDAPAPGSPQEDWWEHLQDLREWEKEHARLECEAYEVSIACLEREIGRCGWNPFCRSDVRSEIRRQRELARNC